MSPHSTVAHPLDDLPIKYVLYTHYSHPAQQAEFNRWQQELGANPEAVRELEVYRFLARHFRGLWELLGSSAYEGLLVIFFDPGFAACLEGIAQKRTRDELQNSIPALRFAEVFRAAMDEDMRKHGRLRERVRIVTPLDLSDIFGRMDWTKAEKLRWWFIGPTTSIRYDTPKIVEAIVRVRLFGSGVPVFRLDWDVLFQGEDDKEVVDLGLFKATASCLRAYQLRRDDPRVTTFLCSAWYDVRGIRDPTRANTFEAWRGALATRIFPAIVVDRKRAQRAQTESQSSDPQVAKDAWEKYAVDCFDVPLARRFYGLADDCFGIADYRQGIGYLGANPLASVVSGAYLCLSDSAILELPPFSSFGLNVSWIDDHLKYSLHRELRHLTTVTLVAEPLLSDAKIDSIMVSKRRAPVTNLPAYALGSYLPTVLWGTVMDAWITAHPIVKFRPEGMNAEQRQQWNDVRRTGKSDGVLAGAIQAAIERAAPSSTERYALKERLFNEALKRITQVRREWAGLTSGRRETFASVWAKGTVRKHFPALTFPQLGGRCLGMVARPSVSLDLEFTRDNMAELINPTLLVDLFQLVDDAYEYIEWTLAWPVITQVIRSVEPGTLRTDLSWRRTP